MNFCLLSGALALALGAAVMFFLSDGGVRRAAHLLMAQRFGGFFQPHLVILGDSLAAGCPWSQLYKSPFAVLNLAEGGATLKQIAGQAYRARSFARARLLIDGGLNDLLFDHATPEQFETDCRSLIMRIGQHEQVIFTLMPFTAEPGDTSRIEAANAILTKLCADHGFHRIDLNPAVSLNGTRRPAMTDDGLHFTRAAEAAWIEEARKILG